MGYLFFSYSRKDSEQARTHVEALRAQGFIIWQDIGRGDDGIPPGADWPRAIDDAISSSECDGIILQWSVNAKASTWVGKEIGIGSKQGRAFYPILLDNTALPPLISRWNGVQSDALQRLMDALPATARRQKLNVSFGQQLGSQPGAKEWDRPLDGVKMIDVPLLRSSYTEAFVVGAVDTELVEPKRLMLCAEFSGEVSKRFLSQSIKFFKAAYPEEKDSPIAVHVRPRENKLGQYVLDDTNYAEWVDAADTCIAAIQHFCETDQPEIHVFAKAPVVLGVLLGVRLPTATTLYLYNDVPAQAGGGYTYTLVAKILTR